MGLGSTQGQGTRRSGEDRAHYSCRHVSAGSPALPGAVPGGSTGPTTAGLLAAGL